MNMLKEIQSSLPQRQAAGSGQTVMVFNADGTPANKVPLVQTPAPSIGAMATVFTLEGNSNPAIDLVNRGAAELYQAQMGGYAVIMKNGKAYAAKLNGDWSGFVDGTLISAFANGAADFETMIHVPLCHFKGNGKTLNFGGLTPVDGGKTFGSPQWVGAYKMFVDGNGVGHSRPDVTPAHSRTMSAFRTCAQGLGSEWGLANYQFHCLINALFQARYGNLNSQDVIGAGFQTVSNGLSWDQLRDVPMGLLKTLGDGSGKVLYVDSHGDNQYPVKLFGFEDLWGKLWEFRPGIRFYMDGQTRKAVVYEGNVVSNTADGRQFTVPATSGYVTQMTLGENWDMIAQAFGGGAATYYCDYFYGNETGELLFVGGNADYGASCGVSYADSCNAFGFSNSSCGARLAFYGEPEIVSGAELLALLA
jgi:hypothetical protein